MLLFLARSAFFFRFPGGPLPNLQNLPGMLGAGGWGRNPSLTILRQAQDIVAERFLNASDAIGFADMVPT
jgi:hypothetical protein